MAIVSRLIRLSHEQFNVGDVLPGAICNAQGQILMPAGTTLTEKQLEQLHRWRYRGIFGGLGWSTEEPEAVDEDSAGDEPAEPDQPPWPVESPEPASASRSPAISLNTSPPAAGSGTGLLMPMALDRLRVGERLPRSLYTDSGVLLLAAGMRITHRFLGRLRQRGIFEVHLPAEEPAHAPTPSEGDADQSRLARELDNLVRTMQPRDAFQPVGPAPRAVLTLDELREEAQRGREVYTGAVERVTEITGDIFRGNVSAVGAAQDVVGQFVKMVRMDAGLLTLIVELRNQPGEYLFQHATNVAALSMAVAAQLGTPSEEVMQIGMGALLQDVGMLMVPDALRLAPRGLSPDERALVQAHPVHTLDFLERAESLTPITMMIAYQVHERGDRSGYPRGRHRLLIHPYARLVSAVDTYVAMTSHRPYRQSRTPYEAMVELLREGRNDRYDRTVLRRMLDTISLFPVGSLVELSDGTRARVLRANPGSHTQPTVVPLGPAGDESDTELDLSRPGAPRVVKALPLPEPVRIDG